MGETVAEIDESHFFQAHRIMAFSLVFPYVTDLIKQQKKKEIIVS